jgi:hypothetical protein
MTWLIATVAVCALGPCLLFLWNLFLYREPAAAAAAAYEVSVLIPARNEESGIADAVHSVLASQSVTLELIVMDDSSTDRTAEIVRALEQSDGRVRLASAPPLPAGWNGKQHACHCLASLARYDRLCFLDADVRVAPDAIARMAAFMDGTGASLVSGFPREVTGTFLERLLLPLIHFVLLAYLPLDASRRHATQPGLAAGCGQFLLVQRTAWQRSGGHAAIRFTMHDGLLLPQSFRRAGYRTDIADLTRLASCRMYTSATQVWNGLAKNATEGMAAPARIVPFSILLFCGQVLPLPLLAAAFIAPPLAPYRGLLALCVAASYLPRILAAVRFRQSWLGALLHSAGVAVLLALQWYALVRKLTGRTVSWKSRAYS